MNTPALHLAPGSWPWDHWQALALERGLAPEEMAGVSPRMVTFFS